MSDDTAAADDFTRTREGYATLVEILWAELPEPLKETREMRYKRIKAAIAAIASLCPVTLAEARLAARHVSAGEHATECRRQVNQLRRAPTEQAKCRAQAASMGRDSDSALRSLQKLQAVRIKRDADQKSAEAAVWAEHIALKSMDAALEPEVVAEVPDAGAAVAEDMASADTAVRSEVRVPARVRFDAETFEDVVLARIAEANLEMVSETESRVLSL